MKLKQGDEVKIIAIHKSDAHCNQFYSKNWVGKKAKLLTDFSSATPSLLYGKLKGYYSGTLLINGRENNNTFRAVKLKKITRAGKLKRITKPYKRLIKCRMRGKCCNNCLFRNETDYGTICNIPSRFWNSNLEVMIKIKKRMKSNGKNAKQKK